jgi:hypothetical protein
MSDERPEMEERGDETFGLRWPPSPKTQIILIAVGIGLLNLLLIVIWAIALYMGR